MVLPRKCRCACCKETTKDRLFYRGLAKLKKEIEIQTIIKNLRVVKAAAKRTFTRNEWKAFKSENEVGALQLTGLAKKSAFKDE